MQNLTLNINLDLLRWIEANRGDKSRAAFVVAMLKEIMHDTSSKDENLTKKEQYDRKDNILNGASDAPEQE